MQLTSTTTAGLGGLFRVQRIDVPSNPIPTPAVSTPVGGAPSGLKAKAHANLEAIRTFRTLEAAKRAATDAERAILSRWSAWGALPKVFDETDAEWADVRGELQQLLTEVEWEAARRTTINAHYTPPTVVAAVWDAVKAAGFAGGFVLEPGCGSGNFIAQAPAGCNVIGVELDPVTAAIAKHTHPSANVRCEGFEKTPFPDDWFDLAIGNVPFGDIVLHDPFNNKGRHSMHNHFIVKSLRLVRPGGLVAVLTSRFTLDAKNNKHREEIAGMADLVGAVRLPGGAMQATAGTRVVADVVIFRKLERGAKRNGVQWMRSEKFDTPDGPVDMNEYFTARPDMVLGTVGARNGQYNSADLTVKARAASVDDLAAQLRAALGTAVGQPLPDAPYSEPEAPYSEPEPVYLDAEPVNIDGPELCEVFGGESGGQNLAEDPGSQTTDNGPWSMNHDLFPTTDSRDPGTAVEQVEQELFALADDAPVEFDEAKSSRPRRKRQRRPSINARPAMPSDKFDPDLHQEGTILRTSDRGFVQVVCGMLEPFTPTSKREVSELEALCDLRDTVLQLIDVQAASSDDSVFADVQAELNERYDSYVERFGPLNRYSKARSGRFDEKGEEILRKIRPRMGGFGEDPAFYTVLALEHFDSDDQVATKADIFRRRVVGPRLTPRTAGTAAEALSICLDQVGRVDVDVIAALLGCAPDDAREQLGGLVWEDPMTRSYVTTAEYLSGNVRAKLSVAESCAAADDKWNGHVKALRSVLPDDLGPGEIDCRLGATWLEVQDIVDFITETLVEERRRNTYGATPEVEYSKANATWEVSIDTYLRRSSLLMTSTWGTPRADAIQLVQWSLNQTPAAVYDQIETPTGKRKILNPEETFKAKEKQQDLQDRFRAWVWEDPARAKRVAEKYNRLFNSVVLPKYDGSHLTLPGLSMVYEPHPHQLDAIWRVLQSPTTLLAHPVGAGKTLVSVCAGMEQRRLGIVNKPCYVVPNHMLEQFASEFMRLYPQAKVLVPTKKDVTPGGRKRFVARCAMGDWDAVVMTHSAFEKIPVSTGTAEAFLTDQVARYREAISESKQRMTIKKLEAACLRMEEKIKTLQAAENKDDGVSFELAGFDYLFIDESQAFKNLPFPTHIRSVGGEGSQRAADVELKLSYLRSKVGDRVATFMTATPIANSIAEMFVVQQYLQPARLEEVGCESFDGWAATFGSTVTALELAPDGGSYRMHTRFARFHNVPELVTMFREVADVLTPDDLKDTVPVPKIAGGKPTTVIVQASDRLKDYVKELVERAKKVRNGMVDPREDNMLTVCGDGRKAALDLRLVDMLPDPSGGKIAAVATNVAEVHHRFADREYMDPDGNVSRHKGAFQLVFCDLGTPRPGWNVYEQLRSEMVSRGVPDHMIRFVHEAKDARGKAELFAACRAGRVSVLIGSSDKMGMGTNVQTRLVGLHHVDCPWRPDILEQRDGRGLRQGNQNEEVFLFRYATEGSFDVYMWQTVERKATFIHQVMRGEVTAREIDDISEQVLSYAEIKALATGNPLIMQKAGVDNEVARLFKRRAAHAADQRHIARQLEDATRRAEHAEKAVGMCEQALEQRALPDEFEMVVDGELFTKRAEAGAKLKDLLLQIVTSGSDEVDVEVGSYANMTITARLHFTWTDRQVILRLKGTPVTRQYVRRDVFEIDEVGICRTIENEVNGLDRRLEEARAEVLIAHADEEEARKRIGMPFDEEPLLEAKLREQENLAEQLAAMEEKEKAA